MIYLFIETNRLPSVDWRKGWSPRVGYALDFLFFANAILDKNTRRKISYREKRKDPFIKESLIKMYGHVAVGGEDR